MKTPKWEEESKDQHKIYLGNDHDPIIVVVHRHINTAGLLWHMSSYALRITAASLASKKIGDAKKEALRRVQATVGAASMQLAKLLK